jgi:hypothetical protein
MPQLDDLAKSDLTRGIAIGLGAAVLIPIAAVALAPYLKPAARTALKLGILGIEKAREAAASLAETLEDVSAEVQDELRAARAERNAAPEPPEPAISPSNGSARDAAG